MIIQGLLNEKVLLLFWPKIWPPSHDGLLKNSPWADLKLCSSFWEIQKFWHLTLLPEQLKLKYLCCKFYKFSHYCLETLVNPVNNNGALSPFSWSFSNYSKQLISKQIQLVKPLSIHLGINNFLTFESAPFQFGNFWVPLSNVSLPSSKNFMFWKEG